MSQLEECGLQMIQALLLIAAAVPAHEKHRARHRQDMAEGRQRQHEQSQKTKTKFRECAE